MEEAPIGFRASWGDVKHGQTRRLLAAVELEANDLCMPFACAVLLVLSRVPERAVVAWIDGERAVIAPSIGSFLRALAGRAGDRLFRGEPIERIARGAPGDPDGWEHRASGCGVADADIALLVHSDASHPARGSSRRIGTLLVDLRR